ncbi:MAG: NOP5/NOP56 family protein [Nanoarchaeota archaeon]
MVNNYLYSNIIGTFVFNEQFKPIKSIMFKNIEDYNSKSKYEKEISKSYKNIIKPNEKQLNKILEHFKDRSYHKDLRRQNIELTRKAVKSSVNEDVLIVQAISNIEDINKAANSLVKRLRDWYGLYNPELTHQIDKHEIFVDLILNKTKSQLLEEIKVDETSSMGADLSEQDLAPIMVLAKQINELYGLRQQQETYLEIIIKKLCPNMVAITGTTIGAKLLARAGSLKKLVEFPSSTIQLLGAEKALFRHLKTKAKSPKYGYLHEHPLISKNRRQLHGKIARSLADKISIAVKVDYFKGEFIGDKLRKGLEKKFLK